MTSACVVMTTVANEDQARGLIHAVLEARLAACAQRFPISSSFWWDGKIVDDSEQLIMFKTLADKYAEIEAAILAAHPYDTPEIIRLPVEGGHQKYFDWIAAETTAR